MDVSLVLFAGHLFLSLIYPRTRHALSGMTRGWVDEEWAHAQHPEWAHRLDLLDRARDRLREARRLAVELPELNRTARAEECITAAGLVQRVDRPHVPERVGVRDDLGLSSGADARREILDLEPVLVVAGRVDALAFAVGVLDLEPERVAAVDERGRNEDATVGAEQLDLVAVGLSEAARDLRALTGAEVEDALELLVDAIEDRDEGVVAEGADDVDVGLGAQFTINDFPDRLDRYYGDGLGYAFEFFLRIRPSQHVHLAMQHSDEMK